MSKLRILDKTEQAYKNMEAVCAMLNALCKTDTKYWVDVTWWDFGAGIKWTTIVNNHKTQILYPREWERIEAAETAQDIADIVNYIRNGDCFRE